ncbi:MAG: DUF975 family protein [Lachnospiraceae bacterium]|nr:DUF975 family protein [Lachnospiraceae bacterium]
MNRYMKSDALKASARDQLLGSYGTLIGTTLMVGLLMVFVTNFVISLVHSASLVSFLFLKLMEFGISVVFGLFEYGFCYMYLKLSIRQHITTSDVFFGFHGAKATILKISFFIALAQELLLLPGDLFMYLYDTTQVPAFRILSYLSSIVFGISLIIFLLTYSLVYYIHLDFPDYTWKQVMTSSAQIMDGNKGRLFGLYVSFLPICLLGILSLGLAFLWITPYIYSTQTNFYLDTMRNRNKAV